MTVLGHSLIQLLIASDTANGMHCSGVHCIRWEVVSHEDLKVRECLFLYFGSALVLDSSSFLFNSHAELGDSIS